MLRAGLTRRSVLRDILPSNLQRMHPPKHLFAAALLLLAIVVFFGVLDCGFLNYDDPGYVTENSLVTGGLAWSSLPRAFTQPVMGQWHPLANLSHMLDWTLYGGTPSGHHLTSLLFHAVNVVLVWLFFLRLGLGPWRSAAGALFFGLHPLRVESVAWIAERRDVLSGFFFLLTLLAYHEQQTRREARGGRVWYLCTLLCCACGLMSKPMLVTLPCFLLLLDFWPYRRIGILPSAESQGSPRLLFLASRLWRLVLEKSPHFILALFVGFLTVLFQHQVGTLDVQLGPGLRLVNALSGFFHYAAKLVFPLGLAPLYPLPPSTPWGAALGGAALLVAAFWFCWRLRMRAPWVTLGILWFFLMLAPVSGLAQSGVQAFADRYTYLPGIGVALLFAGVLPERGRGGRCGFFAWGAACVVICLFAFQTVRQIKLWQDPVLLWTHTVEVTEENPMARFNLATSYLEQGRLEEAETLLSQLVATRPVFTQARVNYGILLSLRGRGVEALVQYQEALRQQPENLKLRLNMARVLLSLGRKEEAVGQCRRVLELEPGNAGALRLLDQTGGSFR